MSKRRWAVVIVLLGAVLLGLAVWSRQPAHVEGPPSPAAIRTPPQPAANDGIGRHVSADEIARRDLTVFPSGAGLPRGRGDAAAGQRIYTTQCAACHGGRGEGNGTVGPALAGGIGSLRTGNPQLTVGSYWPYATTLFDYTRRAMPYQAPGSLTADEVYAVTADVLSLNGIVRKEQVLDERTLPMVKMPNRDGFVSDPRPDTGKTAVRQSARAR